MTNYYGELVDELAGVLGSGVRSIASYKKGDYEIHFMRDDIESTYSREEVADAYKQIEIEGMGYEYFETLFQTGELECVMYVFDDALMFHFPTSPFAGLFVSVDRGSELDNDEVIQTCRSHIE